jgi:7 transmembrane receptor (rhodopsin family)
MFRMSGQFIDAFFGYWPLSTNSCTFTLYVRLISPPAQGYAVLLIAFDRFVAVFCPHWYMNHACHKVSLLNIGVKWIWLHIFALPGLIIQRMNYPGPSTHCGHEYGLQRTPCRYIWCNATVVGSSMTGVFTISFLSLTGTTSRSLKKIFGIIKSRLMMT